MLLGTWGRGGPEDLRAVGPGPILANLGIASRVTSNALNPHVPAEAEWGGVYGTCRGDYSLHWVRAGVSWECPRCRPVGVFICVYVPVVPL